MVSFIYKFTPTIVGMNKAERSGLERIFRRCVRLEREGRLSWHDAGQGDLCIRLLRKRRQLFRVKRRDMGLY